MSVFQSYFDKNKRKMLPWVKDWTSPHDHLRFEPDVNKLRWEEWFWFHPTSYLLTYYSPLVVATIMLIVGAVLLERWGLHFFALINLGIALILLYFFFKKLKEYKYIKHFCYFDLYMREYD